MKIVRTDEETLLLSGLDPFLVELLKQLAAAATVGEDDPAADRLFPNPAPESETVANEEWRQYVTPELRRLFESATETLNSDLGSLGVVESEDPDATAYAVPIPLNHCDAWLNALNQARLALAARHRVTEEDMEVRFPVVVRNARDFALLQIHFYGLLQEFLIEAIDER